MADEVFILLVITVFFGSIVLVAKWTLDYFRDKNLTPSQDHSLTASELQALIEEAVVQTTAPLHEHLKRLEDRVEHMEDARQLNARPVGPQQIEGKQTSDAPAPNN